MENIASLLRVKTVKPSKTQRWQDEALEAIKKLVDGQNYKSSIFAKFKQDARLAQIALQDSLELQKPYARYFFATYTAIRKRANTERTDDNLQTEPVNHRADSVVDRAEDSNV